MFKWIFTTLFLAQMASARVDICAPLFSPYLTSEEKALEFNNQEGNIINFHIVGSKRDVDYYIRGPGAGKVFFKLTINYSKDASREAYKTEGSAISDARLKSMLQVALAELQQKPGIEKLRQIVFADTAVTKHRENGYMWLGVIMQFGERFVEVRLHLSLRDKSHIENQQEGVSDFGMNLLHGLSKIPKEKVEDAREWLGLLKSLNENVKPESIKINSVFIEDLTVDKGVIKERRPILTDAALTARTLFRNGFARSLFIDKDGSLVDLPNVFYKRNIIVSTHPRDESIESLKEKFSQRERATDSKKFERGSISVVALEVSKDTEHLKKTIEAYNKAGIAVWLFNSTSDAANKSLEERVLEKHSYVLTFSGGLEVF